MMAHAPAPSLQSLVEQHGSYDAITEQAWSDFDARMSHWSARQRAGADYAVRLNRIELTALRRRSA